MQYKDLSPEELRRRLAEAEAALDAMRQGEVDMLLGGPEPVLVRLQSLEVERSRLTSELQRRNEMLLAIHHIGRALTSSLDMQEIFWIMYREIAQKLLNSPHFTIARYQSETETIICQFAIIDGTEMDPALLPPMPLGKGPNSETIRSRQPHIVDLEEVFPSIEARGRGILVGDERQPKSGLYVPLIVGDQVLGVMNLQSYAANAYDQIDIDLLTTLASQASAAMQNAALFAQLKDHLDQIQQAEERLEHQVKELTLLYQVARAGAEVLAEDELIEQATQAIGNTFFTDHFGILLFDEEAQILRPHPSYRGIGEAARSLSIATGEGITGTVAEARQPMRVDDISKEPVYLEVSPQSLSELAVPIEVRERLIGVINAESPQVQAFTEDDERLLTTLARQIGTAIEQIRLHQQTQRQLERLKSLRTIDIAMTSSMDLQLTLKVILEQVCSQLEIDSAVILLLNETRTALQYETSLGMQTDALQHTTLPLGRGLAGQAAWERRMIHIPDITRRKTSFEKSPNFIQEGFVSYFGVPLIAKGELQGVLELFHRSELSPDDEWVNFLETLSSQAALTIDNTRLLSRLQRKNLELSWAYDTTLQGWAQAMELRDHETQGHSERVTGMTVRLAQTLGVPETDLVHIRRGAMLHDIGKIGIPDDILHKPGPLSDEEWELMRQHPLIAYNMLSAIEFLRPALDIPYCHHEKWDGTGYPRGLKGEQIPLSARIFAVVDVWDALISDRPYRKAWPKDEARDYLCTQSGKHFDSRAVEAFLDLLDETGEL